VDEGGGVNALDDREGCCFTCFVGAAGLFGLTGAAAVGGEGIIEFTVTGVSGSGVLFVSSGETASAVCIALGYKSPIAVWIVFGYSPFIVAGAAVIIVTNKKAEITGTRRRDHLFLSIVFNMFHPFF
jgi:hypothetical protein